MPSTMDASAPACGSNVAGCGEAGGCGGEEQEFLSYVGSGKGDYTQETTYKYVGYGAGDFQASKVGGNRYALIAAGILGLLVLAVILCICLMPGEATTTTTTTGINCNYGVEAMWTFAKKAYCCDRVGKGCPTTPAPTAPPVIVSTEPPVTTPNVCNEGGVSEWDERKRTFCCARYGNGCPTQAPKPVTLAFDCEAGLANWQTGWSVAKMAWCCQHEKKGCAPVTSAAPVVVMTAAPVVVSLPFECNAGLAHWQTGWTLAKKAWCCQHEKKGCAPVTSVAPVTLPFDCDAGLAHWQTGWTLTKKNWCCQHEKKGCSPVVSLAFDCDAGLAHWQTGWTLAKKNWCCQHVGKGCSA